MNVEGKGWEAGVGGIVEGTSATWQGWTKTGELLEKDGAEEMEVNMEDEESVNWGPEWRGWLPGWKIEQRFTNGAKGLRKLNKEEGKEGTKVATRVRSLLSFDAWPGLR